MNVDPQVAAHYAKQASVEGTPQALDIQTLRANADRIYNDRAQFPPVFSAEDWSVPCPWGSIPLRLYRPNDQVGLPVMMYYHGGGFLMHNIASHDSLCRKLALECGCAVVSVGYRLAPEHPFPAYLEDSYTAMQWVYDNADRLGLDRTRMSLAGDSAGAYISAAVSLLARDRNGPKITLQILCYGGSGILSNEDSESYQSLIHNNPVLSPVFLEFVEACKGGAGYEENPYLNPGRAKDFSGLPKTYSINAENDPLRDDGEAYAAALRAAGNEVILERVPGVYHGFLLLWEELDISKQVISSIAEVVKETFRITY